MKRSEPRAALALLVFEAAGCLMALPASEVARLEKGVRPLSSTEGEIDLDEYFTGHRSDGPWLHWGRGDVRTWLRIQRVVEVVSCGLGALTPMPALLRLQRKTKAFVAAGVREDDVFLLLDPARLKKGDGNLFPGSGSPDGEKKIPIPFL